MKEGKRKMSAHAAALAERQASTRVPRERLGMWWFLGSELTLFAGMMLIYVVNRIRHPDWASAAESTWIALGVAGTAMLLASMLTIVRAQAAAKDTRGVVAARWLIATVVLGAAFLACQAFEYARALGAGLEPAAHLFWAYYFLMTGMHATRVLGGLVALTTLLPAAARGNHVRRIGTLGLYWRFVCIVWFVYFVLLYVVR